MTANENQIVVYQPNETVRLDVRLENEVQTKEPPLQSIFYQNRFWDAKSLLIKFILGCSRAEYGKQVVKGLASRLMLFHGSGWDEKTLRHCLRAAETFGEEEIVAAARRQLSWTHIKTLSYISDSLKRQFYLEMCAVEHWGTPALQGRGLILCAGKNEEHVELLEMGRSNIRVASYMTELPPKKVLEAKFRLAIEAARNRMLREK